MLLGYARVSTDDQDLALQRRALRGAGCRRLYEEKLSSAQRNRPELARLLDQVRDDDMLVVTRLDRLARSTRDLPGCRLGDRVSVAADDTGRDAVTGTLVASSAQETAVRRTDPQVGELNVHFPRAGFDVAPA